MAKCPSHIFSQLAISLSDLQINGCLAHSIHFSKFWLVRSMRDMYIFCRKQESSFLLIINFRYSRPEKGKELKRENSLVLPFIPYFREEPKVIILSVSYPYLPLPFHPPLQIGFLFFFFFSEKETEGKGGTES